MWEPYLQAVLPETTPAHRQRLEDLLGSPLPDRYWLLALAYQGMSLNDATVADPQFASLVLLLVLPPEQLAATDVSYCIEACLRDITDHYPPGLLPFADDTGGNLWAFDMRTSTTDPAIVLIDLEIVGEDGIFPIAPDFDAFMAIIEAGS